VKSYILYHGNCYDGFGAGMVAYFGLRDFDPVPMPVFYGQPPPPLEPGSDVYILDFSYPAKVLLEMAKTQHKIIVLDHHATAEKDLCFDAFADCLRLSSDDVRFDPNLNTNGWMSVQNIQLKFDMTKSGAMLAWEYFYPGKPAPMMIEYLQDRDLWRFKMTNSRAISAYLQSFEMDFHLWSTLMDRMQRSAERQEMFAAGDSILRMKSRMVDQMADAVRWMLFDLGGSEPRILPQTSPQCFETQYFVPVANATVFFSEVGEELLKRHVEAPFAGYYMDRGDGKRQWGLRSRPDFDCSVIAKAFGGGGHKQASGFVQDLRADMFLVRP
jgi:hypothetical protein